MKKSAKDRVFDELIRLTGNKSSVTAEKISKNLGISRQNASHYLTRLVEDKRSRNYRESLFCGSL
ncbi:hypothetical protein LOS20_06185 [Enterococcus faecium]|nr:hypothetical protein [Enterococcus faecium]